MMQRKLVTIVTFVGVFSMLGGCQTMNEKVSHNIAAELNKRAISLDLREAELDKKSEELLVGGVNWRSLLCEPNVSTSRTIQIQKVLKANGFNPGKIDGFIGKSTMKAVNQFQERNGLPVDNYINVETLKALGISAIANH